MRYPKNRMYCQRGHELSVFAYIHPVTGYRYCRECRRVSQTKYKQNNPNYGRDWQKRHGRRDLRSLLYHSAKFRAKKLGIEFAITKNDIYIPMLCPIFHTPLIFSGKRQTGNSPTLDRVHPELGYVKENICVVSSRANSMKRDGTAQQHLAIAQYIQKF